MQKVKAIKNEVFLLPLLILAKVCVCFPVDFACVTCHFELVKLWWTLIYSGMIISWIAITMPAITVPRMVGFFKNMVCVDVLIEMLIGDDATGEQRKNP